MSVYDLAIDVGLKKDSDEYECFVSCVQNILEVGSGYTEEAMSDIMDKCRTSELNIAKRVIDECQRERTSPIRSRSLKWWETYTPRRRRIARDIMIDRTPQRPRRTQKKQRESSKRRRPDKPRGKRPMSPMFEKRRRSMSPMFEKRQHSMSPMFEKHQHREEQPRAYERNSEVPQWGSHKRPMSPMYERHETPYRRRNRSPSPVYQRNRSRKRRRY